MQSAKALEVAAMVGVLVFAFSALWWWGRSLGMRTANQVGARLDDNWNAVFQLARELHQLLDMEIMMQKVADCASRLVEGGAVVYLKDGLGFKLKAVSGFSGGVLPPLYRPAIAREVASGYVLSYTGLRVAENPFPGLGAVFPACVSLPLVAENEEKGFLEVFGSRPKLERALNCLYALASHAAMSIERFEERASLWQRAERMRQLSELTLTLARSTRVTEMSGVLVEGVSGITGCKRLIYMSYNSGTDRLQLDVAQGLSAEVYQLLHSALQQPLQQSAHVLSLVARSREPLWIPNCLNEPRWIIPEPTIKMAYIVPLVAEDVLYGLLILLPDSAAELDEEERAMTLVLANQVAGALALAYRHMILLDEASTDPLTRLANRSVLEKRLEEEIRRSDLSGQPLSLLMLDLDDFKDYNDTCGHLLGDMALRSIGQALLKAVRDTDLVARYGGDEFVVLLPNTLYQDALVVAERIKSILSRITLPGNEGTAKRGVRVSIGLAVRNPMEGDGHDLLEAADRLLYAAKQKGKNRVETENG